MNFEWQDTDVAADTLGVDIETLQQWIDEGRAPSRNVKGTVQVLIELLDDDEEDELEGEAGGEDDDVNASATEQSTGAQAATRDGQDGVGKTRRSSSKNTSNSKKADSQENPKTQRQRVEATPTDIDVISKRELQLAGGMVAAWQRLAEQSDANLVRSRRLGTVSWSLVALLLVTGTIGLWASTRNYTQIEGKLNDATGKLATADENLGKATGDLLKLRTELHSLDADLGKAQLELATAAQRITLTDANAKKIVEPLEKAIRTAEERYNAIKQAVASANKLADKLDQDLKDQKQLVATHVKTITQLNGKIDSLNNELGTANHALAESKKGVEAATNLTKRQLEEIESHKTTITQLTSERDKLQRDLETANKKVIEAATKVSNQSASLAKLNEQLEELKTLKVKAEAVAGLESQVKTLTEQLDQANATIKDLRDNKTAAND